MVTDGKDPLVDDLMVVNSRELEGLGRRGELTKAKNPMGYLFSIKN